MSRFSLYLLDVFQIENDAVGSVC